VVRDERNHAGAKRADLCDADQTNASLEGLVSGMQTPHIQRDPSPRAQLAIGRLVNI